MKILDIGIITVEQEEFDKFCALNPNNKGMYWWIHDMESVCGKKFDLIFKIDFWEFVTDDVIYEAYFRLKKK
jgi:hypothetical protein